MSEIIKFCIAALTLMGVALVASDCAKHKHRADIVIELGLRPPGAMIQWD